MQDKFGRTITDLRLAVTERCNYRCVYCRTGQGGARPHAALSWEEMQRLVAVFVELGIEKLRLTGGEPLLRPGLAEFIAALAPLSLRDIALTTNGHLLAGQAEALAAAGLHRVTVSLDSLRPERFDAITRMPGGLRHVERGIAAAQQAGLRVKVNVVLLRGRNDDEIVDFARWARERDLAVRFIEFMPLEEDRLWTREVVVTLDEIVAAISRVFPLEEQPRPVASQTARTYRFSDGGAGEIGIIAPVTHPFCGACSRVRVTADGGLRTCLFSLRDHDLTAALRANDVEALRRTILDAVAHKEERHHIGERDFVRPSRGMVQIGG